MDAAVSGGGLPAAPANSIQFNNADVFGGDANLTWTAGLGLTDVLPLAIGSSAILSLGAGAITPNNTVDIQWAYRDPVNEEPPSNVLAPLAICETYVGDISTVGYMMGLCNRVGVCHTGTTNAYYYAYENESTINSDSTGPLSQAIGVFLAPVNFGSGTIEQYCGVYSQPQTSGTGTITQMLGTYSIPSTTGTPVTSMIGVRAGVGISAAAVTDAIAVYAAPATYTGATVGSLTAFHADSSSIFAVPANAYGLYIEEFSGKGTTASYNIVFANAGYLGTMASTTGGNLFQGHTAIGNYADVDLPTWAPGDPVNGAVYPRDCPLIINESVNRDISIAPGSRGLVIWDSVKHTGTTSGLVMDLDIQTTINSDSTGPLDHTSISVQQWNYGSGDIGKFYGIDATTMHQGSGTVASLCAENFLASTNATVTDLCGVQCKVHVSSTGPVIINGSGLKILMPTGMPGATITNLIGLEVQDHTLTPLLSTANYNIVSKGANSKNLFEGHVHAGTATIQQESNYLGAELVPDSDLATDPVASGWTLSAGDVWSAGQIVSTTGNTSYITFPCDTVAGSWYEFTVTSTTTGGFLNCWWTSNVAQGSLMGEPGSPTIGMTFQATFTGTDSVAFYPGTTDPTVV
jgi:hypothetical protein